MAQFASLEHALALFSSCAVFSAFIAACRPPVASLLAGNGAANAAVANALSRRHAASNFFIRMGTGTPRGRGASDGARRELPPPRPIDRYGRRRYRPAECESASVGRRRRLGSGGRGSWLQTKLRACWIDQLPQLPADFAKMSHWILTGTHAEGGESRTDPTSACFFSTHFWTFHN